MHRLSRLHAWALALCATLTMAVSYADRQALAVLSPTVTRELNISETAYGWLLSAFSLAYLMGAPLAGRWLDRVGARRGLPIAVFVWSSIAAAHVLLPGPGAGLWALLALRVLLGMAESPSFPGASQTVHRVLPPADRPRGFGVLYVGSSLGAMVVPPIASALEHRFGFRFAFLGVAAVGLAWLPLWLVVTRSPAARQALDHAPTDANTSAGDTAALYAAPPLAGPPAAEIALSLTALVRRPVLLRGIAATLAVAPMMSYALNWSPKYLVATFHLPQHELGALLWMPPVLFDLGSIGFGAWQARRARSAPSHQPPVPLLPGLAGLALALACAVVPWGQTPQIAVLLTGLAMAGGGALFALFTADTLSRVPSASVSAAAGLLASAQSLAYIAASPLIGRGVETRGHPFVLNALAAWLVPGVVAWLLVRGWKKTSGPNG